MNNEQWKPIPGFEGLYEASSLGRIKTIATGQIREPNFNQEFPTILLLTGEGRKQAKKTWRQVLAQTFHPIDDPSRYVVKLRDGNPRNLAADNLYWVLRSEANNTNRVASNARKARELQEQGEKVCCRCKQSKSLEEFSKDSGKVTGLRGRCKPCDAIFSLTLEERNRAGRLLSGAKHRAKVAGLPFNLTLADIVIPEKCPVLGIPFNSVWDREGTRDHAPTIDRVIPSLGYVKGNVVIVSMRANRIKSDASISELKTIASFYSRFATLQGTAGEAC